MPVALLLHISLFSGRVRRQPLQRLAFEMREHHKISGLKSIILPHTPVSLDHNLQKYLPFFYGLYVTLWYAMSKRSYLPRYAEAWVFFQADFKCL